MHNTEVDFSPSELKIHGYVNILVKHFRCFDDIQMVAVNILKFMFSVAANIQ